MLNKAILMGRLTRDPELRHTQSNVPVATFSLAVDRGYSKNNAEGQQTVDFINIVAWRNTAEFVSKWFRKGQLVAVSGRIQVRNWTDKDGNNRTTYEVVADECFFAESKRDSAGGAPASENFGFGGNAAPSAPYTSPAPSPSQFEELLDGDEDLPF